MFEQHLGRSVTIDQAAALLHVSRRTIYNRIRDGKLQTIRTIGGSQRVLLSSLDQSHRPVWSAAAVEPAPGQNTGRADGGIDGPARSEAGGNHHRES